MSRNVHENPVAGKPLWMARFLAALFLISFRIGAQPQTFSSGSTGADGALNITAPGITYLDPKVMKINLAGDNVFNFTTITIASGSTLKISELKLHGPVYFLAQGDVIINGAIDIDGDNSPGVTATATEQIPAYAGSGGYSGGLGGVFGDTSHQALPGNGPGGGAVGSVNGNPYATGGTFTANRFLVPLVGGSGGGGMNGNGQFGPQGGAGGGALLIASSTTIHLDGPAGGNNGGIFAGGGGGSTNGCGGSGGAVRLVANSIVGTPGASQIYVSPGGSWAGACSAGAGLIRLEAIALNYNLGQVSGPVVTSLPFGLNLPTSPPPVIMVSSINGIPINANPFSFPDATINTGSPVPVVFQATNLPANATVTLYLLSDGGANQAIPVTLTGDNKSSTATVQISFPATGTRGFVKAIWSVLGK